MPQKLMITPTLYSLIFDKVLMGHYGLKGRDVPDLFKEEN